MHIISGLGIKARRLEPCAVKVARTVLRGLGEPQGSPGYPAGHDGDCRRYSQADLARIEFFNRLRATGMSIRKMQAFADLARQGEKTVSARRQALEEHRRSVVGRIEELQTHLAALDRKITYYRKEEILREEKDAIISPDFTD